MVLTVKKFWKFVAIRWSYKAYKKCAKFFGPPCICCCVYVYMCTCICCRMSPNKDYQKLAVGVVQSAQVVGWIRLKMSASPPPSCLPHTRSARPPSKRLVNYAWIDLSARLQPSLSQMPSCIRHSIQLQ